MVALATCVLPVRADVVGRGLSLSGVDELLRHTAAAEELEALSLQRSLGPVLSPALEAVPSDLTLALRQTLSQDFDAERLKQRFQALFAGRSSKQHIQKLLAFYRTPLGQRYAQADRKPRPGAAREDSKVITTGRMRVLGQWLDATWTMRRFEAEVVIPALGLGRTMSVLKDAAATGPEELAAPMRSKELRAAVTQHFAEALQGFSDGELATIVRIEQSPAGRWYRKTELDALTQTMEEAFRALELEAQAVRERLKQRYGRRKH